jgi:UDP-N-acetylglucosamine 2-epimerase (non-hydrolysing)
MIKNEPLLDAALANDSEHLHIITVGTKPDIIKQAPVFHALKKKGLNVMIAHTGQHYDYNLSGGMIEELGVEPAVNFEIRGSVHERFATIWQSVGELIDLAQNAKKTPLFYVHGDTMTASAVGGASYYAGFPTVHIEAGIRAYNYKPSVLDALSKNEALTWEGLYRISQDESQYELGSLEPYPEQYNTRSAAPAAGLHFAPDEIATKRLIAEGFREEKIHTVGNSVADITRSTLKASENSTIFDTYPQLANGVTRFCIHRNENCVSEERFVAIFETLEYFAQQGETILFILLHKTKSAIEQFGLEDRLEALRALENVVVSDVWPNYLDVVAAMSKATLCVTDSGSMQEEMHIMNVPCVTIRYGTDRPETLFAGTNVLAPPIAADYLKRVISLTLENADDLKQGSKELYGTDVSDRIADIVVETLETNGGLFLDDATYQKSLPLE